MDDEPTWSSGLATSVGGNLITAVFLLLAFFLRNKCKHYRSHCDSPCCKLDVSDKTMRGSSHPDSTDLEEGRPLETQPDEDLQAVPVHPL